MLAWVGHLGFHCGNCVYVLTTNAGITAPTPVTKVHGGGVQKERRRLERTLSGFLKTGTDGPFLLLAPPHNIASTPRGEMLCKAS